MSYTKPDGTNWRIANWFSELDPTVIEKLSTFHTELIKFNGTMNLISPKTEKSADLIHFADSILASNIVLKNLNSDTIYDFGSGNGFPALVLATMDTSKKVVMVEKDGRKAEFINVMIGRLKLKNAEVISKRLEELEENTVHAAISRGFASVSRSILTARKCCAVGCKYFHLKGSNWSTEVAEIPSQILSFWKVEHLEDYKLPQTDIQMTILSTTKKKE